VRRVWWIAALAAVAMTAQVTVGLAHGATLQRDSSFGVVTPSDGSTVSGMFVVAWQPGHYRNFAVTLSDRLPAAGERVRPDATTVVTRLTALRLRIQPRGGGSPNARNWHRIVVVPLDSAGRRLGEQLLSINVAAG